MEVFWNNGERETIKGLDILGFRQVDQGLEQKLVANITTISIRGRYLTLLPWLFGEYYQQDLEKQNGQAEFDYEKFKQALARMEFIIIASSRIKASNDGTEALYGMIGPDLFKKELSEFFDKGSVSLDFGKRGGSSLNTYIMPCRGFGILHTDMGESTAPVGITPRGTEIYKARKARIGENGLKKLIMEGGTLTMDEIENQGEHFSVNDLNSVPEERRLLREAFLQPYAENPDVKDRYSRFRRTIEWALSSLQDKPNRLSEVLIRDHFKYAVTTPEPSLNEVTAVWSDYELRRRCHFACELLLGALSDTLRDLTEATVDEVLAEWEDKGASTEMIENMLSGGRLSFSDKVSQLMKKIPDGAFLDEGLMAEKIRGQASAPRAAYAVLLMLACKKQVARLRENNHITQRDYNGFDQVMRAFDILDDQEKSLREILGILLVEMVIEPHLSTSLRKLGQGQKCSLRFFPEGSILRRTGEDVRAGYSGSRLGNVLNFLSDAGYLARIKGGGFQVAPDGHDLLAILACDK